MSDAHGVYRILSRCAGVVGDWTCPRRGPIATSECFQSCSLVAKSAKNDRRNNCALRRPLEASPERPSYPERGELFTFTRRSFDTTARALRANLKRLLEAEQSIVGQLVTTLWKRRTRSARVSLKPRFAGRAPAAAPVERATAQVAGSCGLSGTALHTLIGIRFALRLYILPSIGGANRVTNEKVYPDRKRPLGSLIYSFS